MTGSAGAVTGRLTPEHGATLDAALEVLAGPRTGRHGESDPRSPEKRRADALMLLVSWGLGSDQMPETGGETVTMTVVTTPGHLQTPTSHHNGHHDGDHSDSDHGGQPAERAGHGDVAGNGDPGEGGASAGVVPDRSTDCGADSGAAFGTGGVGVAGRALREDAAFLEDGTPLSPETTRRLGCDGWLMAAIVDSAGALLDIGRRSRVVPAAMRRALIVRDGGCAFTGCGRPARWCHAHHIRHWAHGGPTALSNLVLLCAHHHQVVHHDGWTVHLGPDRLPVFTPPRWVDPDQVPRSAWRPLTILRT